MTEPLLLYLGFGCLAGLLSGLVGIGGGIVIVPFLVWHFAALGFADHLLMVMAVATSLATIIITSISAAWAHHRRGAVLWPVVWLLLPGIMLGSALGSIIADLLPSRWFRLVFAAFLLYVALRLLMQQDQAPETLQTTGQRHFGLAGAVIGALSALFGIGGGTLSVPFLIRHGYPIRNAVAISSACGLPIALVGSATYVALGWQVAARPADSIGFVYLPALIGISLASVLLAPVGAALAHRWPTHWLRRLLALMIALGGGKLLWQALI